VASFEAPIAAMLKRGMIAATRSETTAIWRGRAQIRKGHFITLRQLLNQLAGPGRRRKKRN